MSVRVSSRACEIADADRLVLPGVGAFAACIGALKADDELIPALEHAVLMKARPFLGICVGMQLLATRGLEFGETPGLGWIAGDVKAMVATPDYRVPHMGWNNVRFFGTHPVSAGGLHERDFYFVHSFHFDIENKQYQQAVCTYGHDITAMVARDNIVGVQFHPEKSQQAGLAFIDKFLRWS